MQLRSDAIKKGVARAPHRSLLKADGLTDEELERPLIAVISSQNEIIPGHLHLNTIAEAVKAHGGAIFRGGAFKPRTSPYAFQGMGREGLGILSAVKERFGLPTVSEIMDAHDLPYFEDIDILQVGARNMQNFTLLKALGAQDKPVLLKRGMAATIDELLMSAEYIMAGGNRNVILCERGIRSYDTRTRNVFDVSAIPVLRELTHLPIVSDPSHATGRTSLVTPVACAAVAAGSDGLEVEVHHDPKHALSDGAQALLPEQFADMMRRCAAIRDAIREE